MLIRASNVLRNQSPIPREYATPIAAWLRLEAERWQPDVETDVNHPALLLARRILES